jgi:hypothetical protein
MTPDDVRFNRRLSGLVLGSLVLFLIALVLRVGISLTPYETTDSAGRTMGFNDPLSAEHFAIMARNFDPRALLRFDDVYDWVLLAMHGVGLWLLLYSARCCTRLTRWFFALQVLVFPFGAMLFFMPFMIIPNLFGQWDRESFVDIPFTIVMCHPVWVIVSITITIALRAPGLGLARVWRAMRQATSAFGQTFVAAVR